MNGPQLSVPKVHTSVWKSMGSKKIQTHCIHGHALPLPRSIISKDGTRRLTRCKVCQRISEKKGRVNNRLLNSQVQVLISRKCYKCKLEKPLEEFQSDLGKKFGRSHMCLECGNKKYVEISPDKKAKMVARRKEILKTNPVAFKKQKARDEFRKAVQSGRVKRLPCEVCGNPKTDGHHEDYGKPLDVAWLCRNHHMERHRRYVTSASL